MKKDRFGSARFRLKAGLRTLRFWLSLIRAIGVIVPRRLRADWRQEWEAELRYRETLLDEWDKLDRAPNLICCGTAWARSRMRCGCNREDRRKRCFKTCVMARGCWSKVPALLSWSRSRWLWASAPTRRSSA